MLTRKYVKIFLYLKAFQNSECTAKQGLTPLYLWYDIWLTDYLIIENLLADKRNVIDLNANVSDL